VSVFHLRTNGKYFATQGQLGWTCLRDVEHMGGWWQKMIAPSVAQEAECGEEIDRV